MPTLNTLRTKGGIIISSLIGLALLLFVVSDMTRQGGSLLRDRKMRVGRIDGTYVSYVDYTNLVDRFTQINKVFSGQDSPSTQDMETIRNSAWEQMINDHSLRPSFEAMGLVPGEDEQKDMITGVFLSPVITGNFRDPNTGMYDPEQVSTFFARARADASGQMAMVRDYLLSQMVDQRTVSKYMALVSKAIFVTDAEVAQGVRQANGVYDIDYVTLNYATLPDSLVKVSSEEISSYFHRHKRQFERTAARDIKYATFAIEPSQGDMDQARVKVDAIAAEFRASTAPMQYATLNSQATPDQFFYSQSKLDPTIATALFDKPGVMLGPILTGDKYTMSRLSQMKMLPDSMGARHILLPRDQKDRADSLVRVLKAGGNFAALAAQFSADRQSAVRGGYMGVFNPQSMIQPIGDDLLKASKGDIFISESRFGIHIIEVTYKSPLVKKAQIATVTFNIEPSTLTEQNIFAQAGKFQAAAFGSSENFDKAASEQGVLTRSVHIRNTDRAVAGMPDSRELVHWAFNSNLGEVTPNVMTIGNSYVVANLTGVTDNGTAPLESVSNEIRAILVREKKGDELGAKLKAGGGSLAEVSQKVGADVKQAQDIKFEAFYVNGVGVEMALIGAVSKVGKQDVLSAPVKGASGVFMFDITAVKPGDDATPQSERVRLEANAQNYIQERANQALLEESNVIDNRVKFF